MTDPVDPPVSADPPHYQGHRKRLKARFLNDLGASMQDYELLELLLCQTIPRKDVKPLAKDLIARFGSFGGVLSADPAVLMAQSGLKENAVVGLKTVQQAALRLIRQDLDRMDVLSSWQAVIDYCRAAMGRDAVEQTRLLFLDGSNRLIADEVQQRGTVNHTPLYPREVVKRALELSASALIMVHNHPSGDPTPSRPDIDMTAAVRDALAQIDIQLHDHIIISRSGHTSLRAEGYI
ncbi:MAG: DNA repair protein RadC [Alphaproteobacteria bacterium]|nr:DNA repair protein RadC [Alphaproteobacteria bacterium]